MIIKLNQHVYYDSHIFKYFTLPLTFVIFRTYQKSGVKWRVFSWVQWRVVSGVLYVNDILLQRNGVHHVISSKDQRKSGEHV